MDNDLAGKQGSDGGDIVGGDKINTGAVTGEGIAIGRNARVEINRYAEYIVRVDSLEELPPKPGKPPYKGLAYFTEADADIFFGREELSDDLAARIENTSLLAVVGASGSGKSSLLRAGVAPRLRNKNWQIHIISPTADPLGQLANSLTRDEPSLWAADDLRRQLRENPQTLRRAAEKISAKSEAGRFLLIVDQFEELFTLCNSEEVLRAFLDNLLATAANAGGVHILVGLRADFTGRLAEPEELRTLVQEQFVLLGPMHQEELVRVIMEPAHLGGWAFVDGLVEQVLKDVGREPGRLPLLSHALLETWKRRSAHVMTLKGYQDAGGMDGAIAKTAEDTLRRLGGGEQQAIMKSIFLELTELGEGAEDTRRISHRADLARIGDEENVGAVLEALVAARLVTVDGDSVEVAHEALIRRWPKLRKWLDDNRERLRFERQLERDAEQWEGLDRDDGPLYRGAQLARASELVEDEQINLVELSAEFLAASRELAEREEREREAQRQRDLEQARKLAEEQRLRAEEGEQAAESLRRRLIIATGAVIVAVLFLAAAMWFGTDANRQRNNANLAATAAVEAQNRAEDEAHKAVTAEVVAVTNEAVAFRQGTRAAESANEAQDALATSVAEAAQRATAEANAEAEAVQARRSLSAQLASQSQFVGAMHPQQRALLAVEALRVTEDGQEPYVIDAAQALRDALQSISGHGLTPYEGSVNVIGMSQDGRYVLTGDLQDNSSAQLWDLSAEDPALSAISLPRSEEEDGWWEAIFSADNKWLVVVAASSVMLWHLESGGEIKEPFRLEAAPKGTVLGPVSKYGRLLAGTDEPGSQINVWGLDADAGPKLLQTLTVPLGGDVQELRFSSDGQWLLGGNNRSLSRGEEEAGRLYAWPLDSDEARDVEPTLLSDNDRISYTLLLPLKTVFAISPDGGQAAVANNSGSVMVWNLGSEAIPSEPAQEIEGAVWFNNLVYSVDGRWLAGGGTDKMPLDDLFRPEAIHTLRLWPVGDDGLLGEPLDLIDGPEEINYMAMSPDGRWLLARTGDFVHLWDLKGDKPDVRADIELPSSLVAGNAMRHAFSTDGSLLALADGQAIQLWGLSASRPRPIGDLFTGHDDSVENLAIDPRNRFLFAAGRTASRLWNLEDPALDTIPVSLGFTSAVAASRDGSLLATAGESEIALWDLVDYSPDSEPLWTLPDIDFPTSMAFSPDGSLLAFTDSGGQITVLDSVQHEGEQPEILASFPYILDDLSMSFSPDNRYLLTGSTTELLENGVQIWDLHQDSATAEPAYLSVKGEYRAHNIMVDPNGRWVAAIYDDGLTAWEFNPEGSDEPLIDQPGITHAAFSPDGRWLAGIGRGADGFWALDSEDAPSYEPINLPPSSRAAAFAFLPDSDGLLLSDYNGDHYLVDLNSPPATAESITESMLRELGSDLYVPPAQHHRGFFSQGLIGIQSESLATVSDFGLRLWDWSHDETADVPVVLEPTITRQHLLAFSADGRWLVTTGLPSEWTVYLWPLDAVEMMEFACEMVSRSFSEEEWGRLFRNEPYHDTCDF